MPRTLTCEQCGANFECMSDSDTPCWCMKHPVREIDSNILDCLCPSCLTNEHYQTI